MESEQTLAPGFVNTQTLSVLDGDFELVQLYDSSRGDHFYFFHDNRKGKRYSVTAEVWDSMWNLVNEL